VQIFLLFFVGVRENP